jgi:hypothetical protein
LSQEQLTEIALENSIVFKEKDNLGRQVTSANQIILQRDKDLERSMKEIEKLKRLDAKIIFSSVTSYDTIEVRTTDTLLVMENDTIRAKNFDFKDEWIYISGIVKDTTIAFDSLAVTNKYKIEVGDYKKNFLSKKEKRIFIINENPHTDTKEIKNFTFIENKKWYQKDVWKYLGGAAASFFIIRNI